MFDPALGRLIWFQTRAAFRQVWRMIKTPSGAILTLFLLVAFGFAVVPNLMMVLMKPEAAESPMRVLWQSATPLILFAIASQTVASESGQKLMELRPSELQFVLAGPFTTSQILSYRLVTMTVAWVMLSVLFSCVLRPHFGSFAGAFLGICLGGGFIFLLSFLRALFSPRLTPAVINSIRTGLRLCLLGVVLEMTYFVSKNPEMLTMQGIATTVDSSYLADVFGYPFRPFANLLNGQMEWQLVPNAVAGGVLLAIATFCCYRFNDGFSELAVEGVARRQERIERVKGGNLYALKPKVAEAKTRIPMFHWLGGIGPVAWTQAMSVWRRTGRLVPGVLLIGLTTAVVIAVMMASHRMNINSEVRSRLMLITMGVGCYISLLVLMTSQIGFSMNPKLLTWYQMLPIRPLPLAMGMVAGSAFMLFGIRLAFFAPGCVLSNQSWIHCLVVLLAFIVVDVTLASMLNLIAASTDLRLTASGAPDIFQGARAMAFMFALGISMLPLMMIGGLAALAAGMMFGFSITLCLFAAAVALVAVLPVVWWITGYRFQVRELPTD